MLQISGNGGGSVAAVTAIALSGGSVLVQPHGSELIASLFLAVTVLSAVLSLTMLVRFFINLHRNGAGLSQRASRKLTV